MNGERIVTTRFNGVEAEHLAELERYTGLSAPELIRRGMGALRGLMFVERLPKKQPGAPGPARGFRRLKAAS